MQVIGLTGSIGSGKTTVANLFAARGVPVIDADVLAREVTKPDTPAYRAIIERFGSRVLNADGTLDRGSLREIIFHDALQRSWLEALLHPLILARMQDEIARLNTPYCIAVIPLLLETDAVQFIDRILVVDLPEATQIERARLRDNATNDQIEAILKTQISREERLKRAHDVINNAGNQTELMNQIEELHQKYLKLTPEIR
jgi:dephospho-CoA kinase